MDVVCPDLYCRVVDLPRYGSHTSRNTFQLTKTFCIIVLLALFALTPRVIYVWSIKIRSKHVKRSPFTNFLAMFEETELPTWFLFALKEKIPIFLMVFIRILLAGHKVLLFNSEVGPRGRTQCPAGRTLYNLSLMFILLQL